MSISSSAVLVLAVVAAGLAVLRLVEVRGVLFGEEPLRLTDRGSRSVLAFAAHYFFSVFVLGITCMKMEGSLLLDTTVDTRTKAVRLCSFGAMVVLTVIFFM